MAPSMALGSELGAGSPACRHPGAQALRALLWVTEVYHTHTRSCVFTLDPWATVRVQIRTGVVPQEEVTSMCKPVKG